MQKYCCLQCLAPKDGSLQMCPRLRGLSHKNGSHDNANLYFMVMRKVDFSQSNPMGQKAMFVKFWQQQARDDGRIKKHFGKCFFSCILLGSTEALETFSNILMAGSVKSSHSKPQYLMHSRTATPKRPGCLFHGLQRPKGLSKTPRELFGKEKAFKNCLQGSMHDCCWRLLLMKVTLMCKAFHKLIPQSRERERREIPNGNMAGYGSFSQLIT